MTTIGFWALAQEDPERIAAISPEGDVVPAGELLASCNQVARGLRAKGFSRGDKVAWVLPNCIEFLEMLMAVNQIGVYGIPINYHLTGPEIAYIIGDCEAKAFICHARYADACAKAVQDAGLPPESVFSVGGAVPGCSPFEELKANQSTELPENRSAGQTMLYTSGTTGRPKGVHRALSDHTPDEAAAFTSLLGALFDVEIGGGMHLLTGPLYHSAPILFGIGGLNLGQTLVMMDKWDAEQTLQLIDSQKITTAHMVPTMFHRMLSLPEETRAKYDVSSLKSIIHGAAPCPVEVKRRIIEWWGPVLYEYYGATEGGGTMIKSQDWLDHPGSVGKPWPGVDISIQDEEGNELPEKEPGTIYMSSFVGEFNYYKDPEKTEGNRRAGLFTVGDIGYFEDGWLYLCDRKADMIISGGVNIYPAETEAAILTHPKIADVAVFGVPDEDWGESVKAVVQLYPGTEASEECAQEIIDYCRERLAHYKCPRSVDFRDELPRHPTGKLYKRLLRDEYWGGRKSRIV